MAKKAAAATKEIQKILVADDIAKEGIEYLEKRGFAVDVKLGMTPEEVVACIPEYQALIVRSATKVTAEVVEAGKNLRIIGRAGVTVDNIDLEAATGAGIVVCNAPTSNIVSAAEHTLAAMMACARKLPQANASMHAGEWNRSDFMGVELYEKTLAIFGLGRIGGLVAERARAFGMNLVGFDPYCSTERAEHLGVTLYDNVDEVVKLADFISVHLPKTEETIGMFGPNQFAEMKDGVILVNAARGGIFNVKSLADFVAAGKIGAVALDVYEEEPCTDSPLHEFDNVILTPHLAAVTKEAQIRASKQIAEYVAGGLTGSIVPTAINVAPLPPEVMSLVGPYVPACQMMGRTIAQLLGGIPKKIKITLAGNLAGSDPQLLIAGTLDGALSYRRAGTVTPVNADSVAKRHGIRVRTLDSGDAEEYSSLVRIEADGVEIAATVFGALSTPRIVSVNGYKIDIVPANNVLIFEYADAPGRIGTIGTILGEKQINIITMQIGVNEEAETALVMMNVDDSVTDEALQTLRDSIELKNLWLVTL